VNCGVAMLCIQSDMEQHVSGLCVPSEEFYTGFVTWSALEDSLNGLRDRLPTEPVLSGIDLNERTVAEASNQTDPVSKVGNILTTREKKQCSARHCCPGCCINIHDSKI